MGGIDFIFSVLECGALAKVYFELHAKLFAPLLTVKPLNRGHLWDIERVLYSEVMSRIRKP